MKLSLSDSARSSVKVGTAVLLLTGLVLYLEPDGLWNSFARLSPGRIAQVAFLSLVGIAVQTAKWKLLLGRHCPKACWSEAGETLLIGFGLGLLSPGRLGEMGRGLFRSGKDRILLAGLAFLDRSSSSIVTLAAGGVAGWVLYPPARRWIGFAFVLLAGIVFWGWRAGPGIRRGRMAAAGRLLGEMPAGLWGRLVGWSALFNLIFFFQFYLLVDEGIRAADSSWVWGIPLIFALKTALPLGFMDLGVREGAAVLVFSRLGLDPAPAFSAALVLFVSNVLLPGLAGLAVVSRRAAGLLRARGAGSAGPVETGNPSVG